MTLKSVGRPAGHPKSGGRQTGTQNKKSCFARAQFEELGFNPIAKLIEVWKQIKDPLAQFNALLAIMPYMYSRLKESEEPEDVQPQVVMTEAEVLEKINNL